MIFARADSTGFALASFVRNAKARYVPMFIAVA